MIREPEQRERESNLLIRIFFTEKPSDIRINLRKCSKKTNQKLWYKIFWIEKKNSNLIVWFFTYTVLDENGGNQTKNVGEMKMKRDDDEDNYHTFTITKPNDLNDPFRFYRDHIEI